MGLFFKNFIIYGKYTTNNRSDIAVDQALGFDFHSLTFIRAAENSLQVSGLYGFPVSYLRRQKTDNRRQIDIGECGLLSSALCPLSSELCSLSSFCVEYTKIGA